MSSGRLRLVRENSNKNGDNNGCLIVALLMEGRDSHAVMVKQLTDASGTCDMGMSR